MEVNEDELDELIYDEACRLTGMCCLMLSSNGAETSRLQIACQLERLLKAYFEQTQEINPSLVLAIEQLQETAEGGIQRRS